ncbi:hypothetical protein [Vibrio sinaloensis]|uniref:EF-hand domain-containing protein n=1 Tax=Photobacterium sp. (strain ATCC 43367) TaxID=379097 RepID=A0A0A5JNS5_PHOS4|nr:hypothetical protein [Vibrio sinaloensis]KGY09588.1 hypothetical protein NM06_07030 [Vibrio sinaloensis]
MNKCIVPILLGCLSLSLSVDATTKGTGRAGMQQPPVFEDIDTNMDGLISAEEFTDFQKARQELRRSEGRLLRNSANSDGMFERIDINQDEFIDLEEFQSHRGSMRDSKL